MGSIIHGIAEGGTIRAIAVDATEVVEEAVRRHGTSPTATAALGRILAGTLLLGSSFKEFDRITVRLDCDGPIGGIIAEADPNGNVRGYVRNPAAEAPANSEGKFDVRGIVGSGVFYVIRESGFDIGLHRDPYVGSVPITSGEIAEDFAYYLSRSEQIPSAVLLGVLLGNSAPFVKAAGGVMIQMLPGANEHIVTMIEDTITRAPHLTATMADGAGVEDLLSISLGEISYEILDERPVAFRCNCSRERAISMLSALGTDELRSMLDEDKGAAMDCGFCNESYRFDEKELNEILSSFAD